MRESPIQQRILLACGAGLTRLFRQNVGRAWVGDAIRQRDGSVLIKNPRPFIAGVPGMSDLLGWTETTVTQADVGRTMAVFTAIEVKAERGRVSPEQQQFIDTVKRAGGIAGVARSEDDARKLLTTAHTGG